MASSDKKLMSCLSVVTISWAFKDYHHAEQQMTSTTFCCVSYFFMYKIYHF